MSKNLPALVVNTYDIYPLPAAFACPECGNKLELIVEEYDLDSGKILNHPDNFVECTYDTGLEEPVHDCNPAVWQSITEQAIAWSVQNLRVINGIVTQINPATEQRK